MQANLEILSGARKGQKYSLTTWPYLVGRSPDAALQLHPDLDDQASTRHAHIELQSGQYWLVDLNSSNGTFVNGQRVSRCVVKGGDIITFGKGGPVARFGVLDIPASVASSTPTVVSSPPTPAAVPRSVTPTAVGHSATPALVPGNTGTDSSRPPVTLTVTASGHTRTFKFAGELIRIGRHPTNDVTFDPVAETAVSANHAKLAYMAGAWTLLDLDSRNGVWIRHSAQDVRKVSRLVLRGGEEFELGRGGPLVHFEVPHRQQHVTPRAAPLTVVLAEEGSLSIANREQRPSLTVPLAPPMAIGRDPSCAVPIMDPQVSQRHAVLRATGGIYTLEDLDSRNGTYLNGKRIRQVQLSHGDVFVIGGRRLLFSPPNLVLHDFTHAPGLECFGLQRIAGDRHLLDDIWLTIGTGEFAAILGPSGGGKSTLMKALNGYRPADRGTVQVVSSDLYANAQAARSFIGYVPQDDAVHGHLTVRSTLQYVAKLRLPPDFGRAEREARVDQVLSELELLDHQKKYVYQLSGGQRKRVSIGVELLTDPKVLFLDEPTSGLDPGMEYNMMRIGRELACMGRTVIVTTHAMTNIELCDKLIFLVQGKLAYFGPPRGALNHFGVDRYESLFEVYKDKKPQEWKDLYRGTQECRTLLPNYANQQQPPAPATAAPTPVKRAGMWDLVHQTVILFERYCALTFADPWNLFMLLVFSPGVIGLGFLGLNESWAQLLMLSLACYWLACQNSSKEVVKELIIYKRERMVNLALVPYIFSKLFLLAMIAGVQSLFLLMMVIQLRGHSDWDVAQMYYVLFWTALGGVAVGLLISSGARTMDQAQTAVPILLICQVIFSGAFQAQDASVNFPEAIVTDVMSSYWSFDELKRVVARSSNVKTRNVVQADIDRATEKDDQLKAKQEELNRRRKDVEKRMDELSGEQPNPDVVQRQRQAQKELVDIAKDLDGVARDRDAQGQELKNLTKDKYTALWFNHRGGKYNLEWVQMLTFVSLFLSLVVLKGHDYREII
jgi:ABC-type multidrug transport system ATPase subunit/pSer/pThr/pTyr-binding forkhead associated (FHA) protein